MRRYSTFLRLLDEDPVFLERVRQKILTRDLLGLPVLVAQVLDLQRQTLEVLRGFMEATDRRFAAAEAQIQENSRQIAALTEQVRENSRQIAALAEALRDFQAATDRRFAALQDDMGEVKGRGLEVEWTLKAPAYLGEYLDRTRVLPHGVLASMTAEAGKAGRLTRGEAADALRADVVCEAQDPATGERVRVVVEVSGRIGPEDVERARSRAALWSRLGLRAVAVAAGREADEAVRAKARELGVWVIEDGRRTVPEEPPLREA
jgi:hypothetical protein